MKLESDDPACHTVVRLAEDADATAERLPAPAQLLLMLFVCRVDGDPVIEVVPADLRSLAGDGLAGPQDDLGVNEC